jgi:hypothetical protein
MAVVEGQEERPFCECYFYYTSTLADLLSRAKRLVRSIYDISSPLCSLCISRSHSTYHSTADSINSSGQTQQSTRREVIHEAGHGECYPSVDTCRIDVVGLKKYHTQMPTLMWVLVKVRFELSCESKARATHDDIILQT